MNYLQAVVCKNLGNKSLLNYSWVPWFIQNPGNPATNSQRIQEQDLTSLNQQIKEH